MNTTAAPTLHKLGTWNAGGLQGVFQRNGYTQKAFDQHGLTGIAYQGRAAAWFRESLPARSPLRSLARLFLLGDTLPLEEILALLGSELAGLAEIGLIHADKHGVCSRFCIVPYADTWYASDFLQRHGDAPEAYVMGLGPTTRRLACLLPKAGARSVLDLGCGAGWIATRMRRAGLAVTGCDLSPRALQLAVLNEKLAGLSGIDWRQGSWFEPLEGRRFDRICANPPFAQSPGGPLTFREAAPGAESPCATILRDIAGHLEPGGIACVLLDWSHAGPNDWQDPPLSWAPASGLRRWLFQFEMLGPVEYAWRWLRPDPRFATAEAARAELDRWLAHYARVGTGALSSGFLILQRCDPGEEWTRTDSRALGTLPPHAGEEVLRVLQNESLLRAGGSDESWLERQYIVPDGIEAEIRTRLGEDGWTRQAIRLTSPAALAYDGQVDENLLRLLEICRNGSSPKRMITELRGQAAFQSMPDLEPRIAALTRELVRHALVVPA
jgi:SAM-dependent methyltransferase